MLVDLARDELAIAKRYPAQAALCIRDGWEFCRPEHAAGTYLGIGGDIYYRSNLVFQ